MGLKWGHFITFVGWVPDKLSGHQKRMGIVWTTIRASASGAPTADTAQKGLLRGHRHFRFRFAESY